MADRLTQLQDVVNQVKTLFFLGTLSIKMAGSVSASVGRVLLYLILVFTALRLSGGVRDELIGVSSSCRVSRIRISEKCFS